MKNYLFPLALAALCGLVVLVRERRTLDALVLGSPILYVTATHVLLLTEARQSLPATPIVLLLATIGVAGLLPARDYLLTVEPQVDEREHL